MAIKWSLNFVILVAILFVCGWTQGHGLKPVHLGDQLSVMPKRCQTARPFESAYKPLGLRKTLDDFEVYETGPRTSERLLIVAYDIFGFHTNMFLNADLMASEGGFRLVMPDYYRGVYWSMDKFPAQNYMDELVKFLTTTASWELHAREMTKKILEHYKKAGRQIGFYGACWGGKVAFEAGVEFGEELKGVASVHGFNHSMEQMEKVKVPGYLMPARDDPDMGGMYKVLEARFGQRAGHTRVVTMDHGFFSARGNLSDPAVVQKMRETRQILIKFFNNNMN